jgi:hypothetical protein
MLRHSQHFALALGLAITGCSQRNAIVDPKSDVASPKGPSGVGTVVASGKDIFVFDGVVSFGCAGELVHSVVNAPYEYQIIERPTGEYASIVSWDADQITATLTGMTTGMIWTRERNHSPDIRRFTGGVTARYTLDGIFVSETAPTFDIQEVFEVTRNEIGVITDTRSRILRC